MTNTARGRRTEGGYDMKSFWTYAFASLPFEPKQHHPILPFSES